MDKIFDLLLETLNDNSHDVEFEGNVYLKAESMAGDKFSLYREGETQNTLELEEIEYVPVGLTINEPTKYLGSNERIQWQKSLYFPIKSDNHMVFDEDNPRLLAIEETINKLHGKVFDYDGVRIGLKVDDVKRESTVTINGEAYVMSVVRVTAEQVTRGFFGKELEFKIKKPEDTEWTDLDVIEIDIGFGSEYDTTRNSQTSEPNKVVAKNGGVVWNVDFYLDNSDIEKQITLQTIEGDFTKEYDARMLFPPFDIDVEKRMIITQAGKANKKLSIMAINMRMQEAI
jgi:hypothetical protein